MILDSNNKRRREIVQSDLIVIVTTIIVCGFVSGVQCSISSFELNPKSSGSLAARLDIAWRDNGV